jgi:hypothetical protein
MKRVAMAFALLALFAVAQVGAMAAPGDPPVPKSYCLWKVCYPAPGGISCGCVITISKATASWLHLPKQDCGCGLK